VEGKQMKTLFFSKAQILFHYLLTKHCTGRRQYFQAESIQV